MMKDTSDTDHMHLKKLFENKFFLVCCAFAVSFFWSGQCSVSILYEGEILTDSSVFRYVAYAMSKGQIPYKDIFDHKGPLLYVINYAGYLINENLGVYVLEYLALFLTTVFIFLIAKIACGNNILSSMVTFVSLALLSTYFEGGNLTEEYAMPLISISLYIFLRYFIDFKMTKYWIFVCGLCGGGVLMLRPNMAVLWLVFPIFVIANKVHRGKKKELVEDSIMFILGVVTAIIPFVVYFIYVDAFQEFVDAYIKFNMEYLGNGNSIHEIIKTIYAFLSPVLIASIVIITVCIYKKKNILLNTAYLIYMVLSLVMMGISGRVYNHYGMVLIPLFAYPLSIYFIDFKKNMFSCSAVLAAILIVIASYYIYPAYTLFIHFVYRSETAADVCTDEVVNYVTLYTALDEKILVIGSEDILYLKCDRLCVSKYSYQTPIASVRTEIYDEFYDEITSNKPSVIIVPIDEERFYGLDDYLDVNHYMEVFDNEKYVVFAVK